MQIHLTTHLPRIGRAESNTAIGEPFPDACLVNRPSSAVHPMPLAAVKERQLAWHMRTDMHNLLGGENGQMAPPVDRHCERVHDPWRFEPMGSTVLPGFPEFEG